MHPGIADSTWSLKADESYLFSWLVARARALLGPLHVRVGQRVETGAISTIFASIAPELAGATSSAASRGPLDALARAVLGGRLVYVGPSYVPLMMNFFNTSRPWPLNPWIYSKGACRQTYEATQALIEQVEGELCAGGGASNGGAAAKVA